MAGQSHYDLLGVQHSATGNEIKQAYRLLAKRHHPDKSDLPESTSVFQKLNTAYHILSNIQSRREYDESIGVEPPDVDVVEEQPSATDDALPPPNIVVKENMESLTIDIVDLLFLPLVHQCEIYYDMSPHDRAINGLQFKLPYVSPSDKEHYGSISLTFYPSTSRLLVQGTSYLLWLVEHMPMIYPVAENVMSANLGKWNSLTRQKGIGTKRVTRSGREHTVHAPPKITPICLPSQPTHALVSAPTDVESDPADMSGSAVSPCVYVPVLSSVDGGSMSPDLCAGTHVVQPTHAVSTAYAVSVSVQPELTNIPGGALCLNVSETELDNADGSHGVPMLDDDKSRGENPTSSDTGDESRGDNSISSDTGAAYRGDNSISSDTNDAFRGDNLISSDTSAPAHSTKCSKPPPAKSHKGHKTKPPGQKANAVSKKLGKKRPQNKKCTKKRQVASGPDLCLKTAAECDSDPPPSDTNSSSSSCKPDCTLPDSEEADMIRCSLCMIWFHNACIGEEGSYCGAWACLDCRRVPSVILMLQSQVQELQLTLSQVQSINSHAADERIQKLQTENANLRCKVIRLETAKSDQQKLITTMCDTSTSRDISSRFHDGHTICNPPVRDAFDNSVRNMPLQGTTLQTPPLQDNSVIKPPLQESYLSYSVPTHNPFAALNTLIDRESDTLASHPDIAPNLQPFSHRPPSPRNRQFLRSNAKRLHTPAMNTTILPCNQPPDAPISKASVTIIGDSMARDVASLVNSDEFDAFAYVYPGRKVAAISARLNVLLDGDTSDYIVLSVGTSNIHDDRIDNCKQELKGIIDTVSQAAPNKSIIVCSIPPRFDDPSLNSKIDSVNNYIAHLIDSKQNISLLTHDVTHDDYKRGGLHFNASGVHKFANEIKHVIGCISPE